MTEEKKREKKMKRIDPKTVLKASTAVQEALLRATEIQATLMRSSVMQHTVTVVAGMQEAIKRSRMEIQAMARYHEEINRRMALIYEELFGPSEVMRSLMEAQKNAQRLTAQYVKVQDMIQRSMPTAALIPELRAITIRSKRAIQSLYNYIAILEAELARKEEELVKKDEKIRELIRLLKEGKKELKEKYIV